VKPLSWPFLAILSLSLFVSACIPQRTPPTDLDKVTIDGLPIIRVGIDVNFPPFTQAGIDANNPVGFEIDLIKELAAKSGVAVKFVISDPNQLLAFVSQCQLDVGISGITISEPLKTSMDFTPSYYTTGQVVVVKEGNIVIKGKDDLSGMKVGTQDGTPSEIELEKIPAVQILDYATFALAMEDLINGYLDAVVIDYPHALTYVNVDRNNLKVVGDEFGRADYGIAVCKDRTELLEQFNTHLTAIRDSGRLDRLVKKWGIKERLSATR
jgi:ABC-type amino acid transport substrate-binding protein